MLTDVETQAAAEALRAAEIETRPIAPLHATWPGIDMGSAYRIQALNVAKRVTRGETIAGYKVGLTARAMQEMLGVDQPDYGCLLSTMVGNSGISIPSDRFIAPRVELETAFVLREPLAGPGVTVASVIRATDFVLGAIELIDSRVANWDIRIEDTIADNASAAYVILGTRPKRLSALDLRLAGAVLERNGVVVETGAGAAVLGHPANAVAWLANTLAELGQSFEPGQVILPGSCVRAVDVGKRDYVRAEIADLGPVEVSFT